MTGNLLTVERNRFYAKMPAAARSGSGHPCSGSELRTLALRRQWGFILYPLAASLLAGLASGLPAIPAPTPFTIAGTAVAITCVSLFSVSHWGPVFALCLGMVAGATGPGHPGLTALSYAALPIGWTLVRNTVSSRTTVAFVAFACVQTILQATGNYLGQRVGGIPVISVHRAMVSITLTVLTTSLVAALVRAGLDFTHGRRKPWAAPNCS